MSSVRGGGENSANSPEAMDVESVGSSDAVASAAGTPSDEKSDGTQSAAQASAEEDLDLDNEMKQGLGPSSTPATPNKEVSAVICSMNNKSKIFDKIYVFNEKFMTLCSQVADEKDQLNKGFWLFSGMLETPGDDTGHSLLSYAAEHFSCEVIKHLIDVCLEQYSPNLKTKVINYVIDDKYVGNASVGKSIAEILDQRIQKSIGRKERTNFENIKANLISMGMVDRVDLVDEKSIESSAAAASAADSTPSRRRKRKINGSAQTASAAAAEATDVTKRLKTEVAAPILKTESDMKVDSGAESTIANAAAASERQRLKEEKKANEVIIMAAAASNPRPLPILQELKESTVNTQMDPVKRAQLLKRCVKIFYEIYDLIKRQNEDNIFSDPIILETGFTEERNHFAECLEVDDSVTMRCPRSGSNMVEKKVAPAYAARQLLKIFGATPAELSEEDDIAPELPISVMSSEGLSKLAMTALLGHKMTVRDGLTLPRLQSRAAMPLPGLTLEASDWSPREFLFCYDITDDQRARASEEKIYIKDDLNLLNPMAERALKAASMTNYFIPEVEKFLHSLGIKNAFQDKTARAKLREAGLLDIFTEAAQEELRKVGARPMLTEEALAKLNAMKVQDILCPEAITYLKEQKLPIEQMLSQKAKKMLYEQSGENSAIRAVFSQGAKKS